MKQKKAILFKNDGSSANHVRTWKMVVETIGKTVNKKMMHKRIVLDINAASAAVWSSVLRC